MSSAVTEAGRASRIETCVLHRIPFPQIFFPPIVGAQQGFWAGSCPECNAEEKHDQQVNEFLLSEENAIISEATKTIQERTHQAAIDARTKKDLAADVAEFEKERRLLWRNYNTELEWNEIVCEIEGRKRAEFISAEKR
jgi:hypothetical protein